MTSPFGPVILEHFRRPRNRGPLANAHVSVEGANPLCGDRIRVQLAFADDGTIAGARFTADACAVCVAAASLLMSHVTGLRAADAFAVDDAAVLGWLATDIPPGRRACATLPLETMRRGIGEYRATSAGGATATS